MSESNKRQVEFESLRGLSIVLLLLLHSEIISGSAFGYSLDPVAKFIGAFLLGSFFFLAGYFMDSSVQKYRNDVLGFIKSRFVRIFPPYWLSLIFFFIMYTLKRYEQVVYLANLQAVFSPEFVKPLLTLWYISMLVVYYILFGVMLWNTRSNRSLLFAAVGVFTVSYILHATTGLLDQRFFRYFPIFLVGIYFYRFESVRKKLLDLSPFYKILLVLLGSAGFLLVQFKGFSLTNGFHIIAVDFFILSWVLLWLSIFRTSIGEWRIWVFLSVASYFAYLFHRPIWHGLHLVTDPEAWGGIPMFDFLPGTVVTLIVGYFLQRGYDRLLAALHLK
ncbi:MAG TPA: acyltransferase [Anaerolineales bacterium]|nr:acyltransferase [Anaerolineales bacterium]